MRILIHGDYLKENSGYAKEIRNIIPYMLEKGHDVRQVGLNYSGLRGEGSKNIIQVYPTRLQGVAHYWAPDVLDFAIDDFKPDIVLTIGDYFPLPLLAPVLSKPRKHDFKWAHWGVVDGEPMRKEYGTAAGWAHLNIVHSHFGARALIHSMKKSYKNPTCKVLYPPIDLEVFKPISKEGLREKYTTKDRFTVLLVARNQYRKNFPVLIEAVKRLSKTIPNIQLLMVAAPTISPFGAPEGYDLAAIVDEEGVKEYISSVRTNRMVDEKTLNEIYNSADILCLPSFGEGFGLPIAEAFAVGIPVVATNCSSITELLSDDRGILVNPSATIWQDGFTKHAALNSEKLANAIFKAYQDQALRDRCVAESGKFIRALEKNLITAELIKMFEKVIEDDVQPTAVEGL